MGIHHVLIVDHSSEIGGAEVSLEALLTGMPDTCVRYTVALPGPGLLAERLGKQGFNVEVVRMEGWRWWVDDAGQYIKFLLTIPLQLVSILRWIFFLSRARPDLIHFNINRLIEPVIAARVLGIPSVIHFRDIPSRISHHFVLGLGGFYALMNLANHWIANSHATGRDIEPHARRPVSVIPNAIDLKNFDRKLNDQSSIAKQMLSSAPHHIAMIGLLNAWKNQLDLVYLASLILQERQDVTFYIVGAGDKTYADELKRQVNEMSLAQSILFLGHLDCIPGFLTHLDLIVHTMAYESFGRVFIETMAARKPVVAFNSGGAAEIVVNGETGLLVTDGDLKAMANAVSLLLDNPECRNRMGDAGRRRVEDKYALASHCQSVLDVYLALMQPSQAES